MQRLRWKSIFEYLSKYIDRILILGIVLWSLSYAFTFPEGNNINRLWSDSEAYYAYLPAIFIYGSFEDLPIRTPNQFRRMPQTNRYNLKTTYGVALFQSPFFLTAHLVTKQGWFRTKYKDHFSGAYSDAVVFSAIFYTFFGLWMLASLLRRFYQPVEVAIVIAVIFWGTNLFYYVIGQSGMSHAYGFVLNTFVLYASYRCLDHPTKQSFAILGLALGLAVLVRPTNVLMLLFPLLFHVHNLSDWQQRRAFIWEHRRNWWVAIPVGIAVFLPQMAYWQHISEDWIFYSYQGEGFIYWDKPFISQVFFGPIDGLFQFSPLILFGFVGILIEAIRKKGHGWVSVLMVSIATYAFASWWAYWFGSSFGHRAFIDWYPVLAFGLAYLVHWVRSQHWILQLLGGIILTAGIWYSVAIGYAFRYYWSDKDWTWEDFYRVFHETFW